MPSQADDDPLVIRPPTAETPTEKVARLASEEEARQISALIDQQIRAEKAQMRKSSEKTHKVLLLGQAESGKTTILKNFQLQFTPKAFQAQQRSWKPLIQLNLVRSILVICDTIADDEDHASSLDIDSYLSLDPSRSPTYSRESLRDQDPLVVPSAPSSEEFHPYPGETEIGPIPKLTTDHHRVKMRLSPLQHIQNLLIESLAHQFGDTSLANATYNFNIARSRDFVMTSNSSMKGLLGKSLQSKPSTEFTPRPRDVEEIEAVLRACRDDMIWLWNDPTVREILHRKDVRLEEGPGFFLHEIRRITEADYTPTQEDVLRARIRTLGVQEYIFVLETGPDVGREWRIYDVGGSRHQRHAWAPFFDDCHLIFLCPISCYDQVLTEDRRINRLEDSIHLWKSICSSKLLQNSEIVLFLNKCDILQAKLQTGTLLSDWIPQYKDPNTLEAAYKFFRGKLRAIQKAHSPLPRNFYCHMTAATDARSTAKILSSVQEIVTRAHLENVALL